MEQLFFLFTVLLLASVIMTITSTNPVHSIFWLVLVFLYSAGLLISLNFDFIGLMVIIIYVGAITILFLFVIMMLDIIQLKKITSIFNITPIMFIIFINIILETWWSLGIKSYNKFDIFIIPIDKFSHINNLGLSLYTEYAYPLLLLSLLLLVAMVGAIVLTLELGFITRKQDLTNQHQRNNSWM